MQELLKKAIALHQAGNLIEAEKLYQQLLKENPQQADVLHLLGILSAQQNQFTAALNYLNNAITLQTNNATFYNSLGNVYKNLGDLQQAITNYQKALALDAKSASANNNLAILFYQQGDYQTARYYYLNAIKYKPDYADAHYHLSHIYFLERNFSAAVDHLQKTLQHSANHPQALTLLGQIYIQQGETEKAIHYLQKRLEQELDHAETHHHLAVALTKQDKINEAIQHYQKTLTINEKHAETLHNLGALYLLSGKLNEALKCYLQLLQTQPDLDTYYNLGVIYMYQDRHDDAINYLLQVLTIDANYVNALINLGAIYLKKEDYPTAISYYEQAVKLQPNNNELHYLLKALMQTATPTAAPREYIEHLFDQYAQNFDRHLTAHLHYQVPELLYKAVINAIDTKQKQWTILDLGCGTGLSGEKFKALANSLIGIDISQKMLAIARQKNIYSELHCQDINEALVNYHNIDLILAADVFGYIGELKTIFINAYSALTKNGLFAFTVEKTDDNDYILQQNARFAHNKNYIAALAKSTSFTIKHSNEAILRTQKNHPVIGYIFILKKQ